MKKKLLIVLLVLVILLGAIGGTAAWLYRGTATPTKLSWLVRLHLPVARVGNSFVGASALVDRFQLAQKVSAQNKEAPAPTMASIIDQITKSRQLEVFAQSKGVGVTSDELNSQYKVIVNTLSGGNEADLEDQLNKQFGMTATEFKNVVVASDALQDKLALWYNQQSNLNSGTYTQAAAIAKRLQDGEDFAQVAQSTSQDTASKSFGGESGFVAESKLLPELRTALSGLELNQVATIPSRYGLHIIKPLERNNDGANNEAQIRVQQIFLPINSFTDWYLKESPKIPIQVYIKAN